MKIEIRSLLIVKRSKSYQNENCGRPSIVNVQGRKFNEILGETKWIFPDLLCQSYIPS